MDKPFWIRDEHDGVWGEYATREEAEADLAAFNETTNRNGRYDLRIDNMED